MVFKTIIHSKLSIMLQNWLIGFLLIFATKIFSQVNNNIGYNPAGVGYQSSVLTPELFGGKADFKRNNVATTAGSKNITCTTCAFVNTDIGKVVAIKTSRYDSSYVYTAITMNAKIVSINSGTVAVLDSFLDKTNASVEMLWGTNNYNAIQLTLDFAYDNKINQVFFNSGTYYIVPAKATTPPVIYSSKRGLAIRGSVSLIGAGRDATILKFGEEDVMRVNLANIYGYNALHLVGNGDKTIKLMTIEAPDRLSTETAYYHTNGIATEALSEIRQNVTVEDVYLKGQWSESLYSSFGGKWNAGTGVVEYFNEYHYTRLEIECRRQGIVLFTNNGPTKKLWVTDVNINGGGAVNEDTLYGVANITIGTNILTINDPSFSWYDFITQYSNNRKPTVEIGGHFGKFTTTIASINSPTVAVLTVNSTATYTNDTLYWYLNSDRVEGHSTYIHPNISQKWKNVHCKNVSGRALNIYSAGGQPGKIDFFEFDNCSGFRVDGTSASNNFVGTNISLKPFNAGGFAVFRNCDRFNLIDTKFPKSKVYNCNIASSYITDTSEFYNCTGQLLFSQDSNKLHKIFDCNLEALYPYVSSTYYVEGSTVQYLKFNTNIPKFQMVGGALGSLSFNDLDSMEIVNSGTFKFWGIAKIPPRPNFQVIYLPIVSTNLLNTLKSKITDVEKYKIEVSDWMADGEWKDGLATLNFPDTPAGASSDLTITVNGVKDGDYVELKVPNVSINNNGDYSARVTADNTVTVRFLNNSLVTAINPTSGTFKVRVFRY